MVLFPADMPINYGETLDALENSAIAIYDFARRCNADRYSTSTTSNHASASTSSETTYARLPSKVVVNMMAYNGDIIKKRMEDLKNIRRFIENRNSGDRGGAIVPPPGTATRKGRKRIREHVRDVDGKKTIGAPNAAGKCYNCGCTESTEWRRGPEGQRTLCNKCGLQYSKSQKTSRVVR
ncbi:hypothetical protein QBC44DRAFT_331835 [Cladorrhinum sp. PSN332]|nr:hypothetical protein QBC44DRAFT_331835 [Cladorrhinum sp. PSN332]